jgi:hypothetical protein
MSTGIGRKRKTQKVSLGEKGSFSINKGGLHRALGIPEGQKLTAAQKEPKPGDSEHVKRMKASAKGFAAMHHGS